MQRANIHRPQVLVVEDEPLVAMVLTDMLIELECDVVGPIASVGESLAALQECHRIDAAIIDFHLQGEQCLPVADVLAGRGVPFAFTSGYRLESSQTTAYVDQPVLTKPFGMADLVITLSRLLGSDMAAA